MLGRFFADPELNLTLELFLHLLRERLGSKLLAVILYGSILFDDLSPGYGDLDFLAVLDGDLTDTEMQDLIELRKTLRQQNFGWYAKMLEGAFLPKAMLDPMQSGRALWWGTSGERGLQRNELGAFVLRITKEMGITIWGADLRREIPDIGHGEMIAEAVKWCRTVEQHGVSGRLHSVEWLLSTARMLLWLREGRFCSKSEAADWGYLHLDGEWRLHLPEAKRIRRQPELAGTMDVKAWLDGLMPAIKEAASDLRSELSQQRG